MWTFTLLSICLFALVSATWRPIVGPSSSSFNKKVPFGDSHTYYGNEFLSEYSGLGEDHLLVPNLSGPHESAILESDSLGSLGKSPEIAVIVNLNYCEMWHMRTFLIRFIQDKCRPQKYALEYEGSLQIDQTLPSLDQFTLCNWMRFTNHSGDHTVLTYSRKFKIYVLLLITPPLWPYEKGRSRLLQP